MEFIKEFIFDSTFQDYHASTLLECSEEGQFLAACFSGSCEGKDDVGILLAKRQSPGHWVHQHWKVAETPHWNPVLFRLPDSRIACYFKVGAQVNTWRTMVRYSCDEGETWSDAVELVPGDATGGRGPAKNKPIRLADGTILAPASTEIDGHWKAYADISPDGGNTWTASAFMPMQAITVPDPRGICSMLGVIQPSFWQDSEGIVHAVLRSNNSWIYHTESSDQGQTWSEIAPTSIPNNNSGVDCVRRDDGTIWLLCNPVAGDWAARNILAIYSSADNGRTWNQCHLLEQEPLPESPDVPAPEFSYPAVIATRRQLLAATYTFNRKNIAFILEK